LPAATPSPLTTDTCSTTDTAGGSTAVRRTHPVRPKIPTSETDTLYSTVVVTSPDADVTTAATCAVSLRKSRETNWQSHATSISAGASSASDSVVATPAAPAVSSTMYVLPTGVNVTVRPPGSACSTRSTTLTSEAGDATSGARPPAGPASKLYVTVPNGVREGVRVAVREAVGVLVPVPVALGEPVPVELDEPVPVALDEGVPVVLLEPVPVWLPVPVALDEPVPVALLEPVPVKLAVLVALDEPVPVALDDPVLVWLPVTDGVELAVWELEGVVVWVLL
jgi:hypothetical protein